MRRLFSICLFAAVLWPALQGSMIQAQPQDGDLIIGNFRNPRTGTANFGPGSILSLNTKTGAVFTIHNNFTTVGTVAMGPNWIEMASNNVDIMVASIPSGAMPTLTGDGVYFHTLGPTGTILNTLVADATPGIGYVNGFDLDFDGTWILAGGTSVWSYKENTKVYTTLFNTPKPAGLHNTVVIDRDNSGPPYVIGKFNTSTASTPILMGADRTGYVAPISTVGPAYISGVKIDRTTGDYISSAFGKGFNGSGGEFSRTTKAGLFTALNSPVLTPMFLPNGIYLDQEHNAWILTYDWQTRPIPSMESKYVCAVYKMDLQGVFLTIHTYASTLTRGVFRPAGITGYGSRHVTCLGGGKPGSSVDVFFSSHKPSDAGKPYQLVASFGYTNGVRMLNGEWLDLSYDVLLVASLFNWLPMIFQDFSGYLDANGKAKALVNIPAGLPRFLGTNIFVSGVVIDPLAPGGIGSVGNTHWFMLW